MLTFGRRAFLKGATLGAAGLAAGMGTAGAAPAPAAAAAAAAAPQSWTGVRELFRLRPDAVQFAGFLLASHPRPVREAIERYARMLDEDPEGTFEKHGIGKPEDNLSLRVRVAAAAYLGGRAEDVALTQSTTMGLAFLYNGLPLAKGDEILTTVHDHYSSQEPMRFVAERTGATVRRIKLYDGLEALPSLSADQIVARIRDAISPATRVIGLTWVHSESGLKIPLRAIAAAVREVNARRAERDRALIVVDGVHGFGIEDETIATTGIDAFASGTHKWLLGPRGTGLIWARAEVWARMKPFIPTFDSEDVWVAWLKEKPLPVLPGYAFAPGGFHAFEHEWAVADAFELHASLGRPRIAARLQELNTRIKEGLRGIRKVRLHTPLAAALSAGLVGFDVDGLKPEEVVGRLKEKRIIASTSPYRRPVARLSGTLIIVDGDVDKALAAVRAVAGS